MGPGGDDGSHPQDGQGATCSSPGLAQEDRPRPQQRWEPTASGTQLCVSGTSVQAQRRARTGWDSAGTLWSLWDLGASRSAAALSARGRGLRGSMWDVGHGPEARRPVPGRSRSVAGALLCCEEG